MITEDYVSFEVAKLLKEKGFDEPCQFLYFSKYKQEGDFIGNFYARKNSEINEASYSAPTLQMAMKWLREVHNLWCEISWEGKGLWCMEFFSLIDEEFIPGSIVHEIKSYEEACETGIRYALENLI